MRCLDLFCGLGGWSRGFEAVGFDLLGVDIVDVGYPYDLLLQDVRTLDGARFHGFDVIVGSPPCRDFTLRARACEMFRWREPPDPVKGLSLVYAFLRVVREAKPKFWIMENVPGLCKYLPIEPRAVVPLTKSMRRALWGDFPKFYYPLTEGPLVGAVKGPLKSWQRAEIPFNVSSHLALACKGAIESCPG